MGLQELVAMITLVPALAWFVTAGIKIYKLYQTNEDKIKKVAVAKKEELRGTAEEITTKVEEMTEKAGQVSKQVAQGAQELKQKVEKITPPKTQDDESEPTTEGGSD